MQAWEAPTTGTVIGVDVCEVEGVVVAVVSHEVDDELNEEVQEAVAEVASAAAVNRQAKLSPGHAVDASLLPADRVNAYSVAVRRTQRVPPHCGMQCVPHAPDVWCTHRLASWCGPRGR